MPEETSAAPEQAAPPPPELPAWVRAVRAAAPDAVTAVFGLPGGDGDADVATLRVQPEAWVAVAAALKTQGFDYFADLAGVDHPERDARLEIILHLRDLSANRLVRCVTEVREGQALESLEPLFGGAGWPEREIYDLLGTPFRGNEDLRRLLLPEDWSGHPLRRDYPLTGPRELDPESPYAH